MRIISVKFPEELIEMLDTYAFRSGKSRSDVIRDALKTYLDNNATKHTFSKVAVRRVHIY
ncbi:MAG: ribbon-helix-helix protein, CopG family [Zestosphaera sp.]